MRFWHLKPKRRNALRDAVEPCVWETLQPAPEGCLPASVNKSRAIARCQKPEPWNVTMR